MTLLDLTKVYLRGYVPEGQIGKVKLGQARRVYLDSNPTKPVDGEVSRIDPQATFTPENTYFRDDRVKQVVGVKLLLKGSFGFAKPGMPGRWRDSCFGRSVAGAEYAPVIVADSHKAAAARYSAAISVRQLRKTYGKMEAVRGIDLSVTRGEIFGLIGPDGAGKTTTFQILGGVMEATSGAAEVFGQLGAIGASGDGISDAIVQSLPRFECRGKYSLYRRFAASGTSREIEERGNRYLDDVRHGPLQEPAGRAVERRDEAKAFAGVRVGGAAARPAFGRADDGRRPGFATRILGHAGASFGGWADNSGGYALFG